MDEVTQVLFGMDGFRVLGAVTDPLDGELAVLVETIDPRRGCGAVGQVKQRPVVSVRDVTSAGRRVRVRCGSLVVLPRVGLRAGQLDLAARRCRGLAVGRPDGAGCKSL